MARCSVCGKLITCPEHAHQAESAVKPCPLEKGALWVQVLDDGDKGITGVPVSVESLATKSGAGAQDTVADGLASFDPMASGDYTATLPTVLPKAVADVFLPPELGSKTATVQSGQIAFLKFKLVRKKPKIAVIDAYDFLELVTGETVVRKIQIGNVGNADLVLSRLGYPAMFPEGAGNVVKTGATIKPGETVELDASFAPTKGGAHAGDLEIDSNDADGKTKIVKLKGVARRLELLKVDDHFAPKLENLEIRYVISGMETERVVLRISGKGGAVVYERELTDLERAENLPDGGAIAWDGTCGRDGGSLKTGDYLTPEESPYKVELVHAITASHPREAMHVQATKVICDLELEHAPWLEVYQEAAELPGDTGADPPAEEAKRNMWLKLKLNQIGIYAGPINGDAEEADFEKALRRYRLMRAINGAVARQFTELGSVKEGTPNAFPAELTVLTADSGKVSSVDALVAKLKLEETADPGRMPLRAFDQPGDVLNPAKDVKVFLDGTRFYIDNPRDDERLGHVDGEWVTKYGWSRTNLEKYALEDAWLSYPLIPLRAKARIQKKDDSWEPVPDEVRVKARWFWWDLPQDTSTLPCEANAGGPAGYTTPDYSQTKAYVDKALAAQQNRVGSAFYQNNASAELGGLLTGDDTANAAAVWRLVKDEMGDGRHMVPVADRVGSPGVPRGYVRTSIRKGKSWVYFRPSRLAGERYQLGAELDIGTPADDTGSACKKSAKLTVWRRLRLAAFVPWVDTANLVDFLGQPIDLAAAWRVVQEEYAHAYIDLDPLTASNTVRLDGDGLGFSQAELEEINRVKQRKDSIPPNVLAANRFAARFADAAGSTRRDPATGLKAMEDAVGAPLQFDPNRISSISLFIFPKPAPTIVEGVNRVLGAHLSGRLTDYLEQCIVKSQKALGKQKAIQGLRWCRKIYVACAAFTSATLPVAVVQVINRAGEYYANVLGKLANASDDTASWNTGDADTWTPHARFDAANIMTSLFGGTRLVPFTQVEATPPVAESDFDNFAAYLAGSFYPAVTAVLQIAVAALGETSARNWQKELQFSWGTQDSTIGDSELSVIRVGEFWTMKAVSAFASSPKNSPAYFTTTKATLQQEAQPAVRNNFSLIFYALFYRLSRQLNLAIRNKLKDQIEGPWPDGVIVVFNYTHGPFDFGTVGNTGTRLTFQPMGASMALEAGVNWSSQTCFFLPGYLMAHELAHSVFLKHWIGGDGPDFTSHDNKDYNCMMGYPHLELPLFSSIDPADLDAGQQQILADTKAAYSELTDWAPARRGEGGKLLRWSKHALPRYFKPHFCGKCNLMLRGWNIWGGGILPKSSMSGGDYDITAGQDLKP